MLSTPDFIKKTDLRTTIVISFSIISLVSFICYSNSLQNDFVYDDKGIIVKNEMVTNATEVRKNDLLAAAQESLEEG